MSKGKGKRFTDINKWEQDWFLELSWEYKLFWLYINDKCNHAGFLEPNVRIFNLTNNCEVNLNKAIEYFNHGRKRVSKHKSGEWYLEDLIYFQSGSTLNLKNNCHNSIYEILYEHDMKYTDVRGLKGVSNSHGKGQGESSLSSDSSKTESIPSVKEKEEEVDKENEIEEEKEKEVFKDIEKKDVRNSYLPSMNYHQGIKAKYNQNEERMRGTDLRTGKKFDTTIS